MVYALKMRKGLKRERILLIGLADIGRKNKPAV